MPEIMKEDVNSIVPSPLKVLFIFLYIPYVITVGSIAMHDRAHAWPGRLVDMYNILPVLHM